jgi:hypothetical protein
MKILMFGATALFSLRTPIRPSDLPPLSPIRSLVAYFLPIIEELLTEQPPEKYLMHQLKIPIKS